MNGSAERSTVILRPVEIGDAERIWSLLEPAGDELIGMSSLPASAAAAKQICQDTAETMAELATDSFRFGDGAIRRLLFIAIDPRAEPPAEQQALGLTGVTFKRAIPNLAVRVTTGEDGNGLIMRSSSVPWTRIELDSSYLGPAARGRRLGTLLSRGRFMLLQLVRSQVPAVVASNLRGRFDADGSAPFWRHFGAHFAPQWITSTDAELALLQKPAWLEQLAGHALPLTADVLACIGPVNQASMPAYHVLRVEGLKPNGMYDPVDGGPTVAASLDETVTARHRVHGRARIAEGGPGYAPVDALVSVATVDRFRVARGPVSIAESAVVTVGADLAQALDIVEDTLVAAAPLRPDEA